MKLALVTETYPPEVNGVAMTLNRLVRGMVAQGHQVEVVRPLQKEEKREGAVAQTDGDGDHFLVLGMPIPFYQSLRMGLPVTWSLLKRWRETKPDVVHVATEGPLGLAALYAARRLGLPVTSSFHTNFHQYGGHYGMRFGRDVALRYLRWFHNRTRCTMVPTEAMKRHFATLGFERLAVLARGVDTRQFSPEHRSASLRAAWNVAADAPVVIYVGRIAAEKNLGLAVEAFLKMQAADPRARFVLVGDGPEKALLCSKYPQFHYAGMRTGEDLAAHYASADIFIFASVTETFGNVVTEAMASGLVVVAYDYAAARQFMRNGENGYLAEFDVPASFVEAARNVMNRSADWARVRQSARETALAITWEAIVAQFLHQVQSVAETARATRA